MDSTTHIQFHDTPRLGFILLSLKNKYSSSRFSTQSIPTGLHLLAYSTPKKNECDFDCKCKQNHAFFIFFTFKNPPPKNKLHTSTAISYIDS